jgi:hypothetical protein
MGYVRVSPPAVLSSSGSVTAEDEWVDQTRARSGARLLDAAAVTSGEASPHSIESAWLRDDTLPGMMPQQL